MFRLANTLRQRRFLTNPKGSKDYILGPTAWRLSRRYGRNVLGTFFHHYLQELTATLGETSHFTVREGVEVFFIDHQTPTGQVVSVAGQTGEFAPLHCTAHGKALLADCDLPALRDLLGRGPLQVYTRTTVKSVTALARVCAQVRADGFAVDDGEYIEEVRCVAAPIRDPQGEIVASVGISSPVTRLQGRAIARAAAEVKKTAEAISASLGGLIAGRSVRPRRTARPGNPFASSWSARRAARRAGGLPTRSISAEALRSRTRARSGSCARRRRALDEGAPLQHLHPDVSLVLDGLGHEGVVKRVEHLAFARGRHVHFHIQPNVLRLRTRRCGKTAETECGGRRRERGSQDSPSVHMPSRVGRDRQVRGVCYHVSAARR